MEINVSERDHATTSEKTGPSARHHETGPRTPTQSSPNPSGPPSQPSPYAEHGPLIDRSMTAEGFTKRAYNSGLMWPRIRHFMRAPFSEFMGTFILIMFGDGVVAQVKLSQGQGGDYQSISWGWVCYYCVLHLGTVLIYV